MSQTSLAAADPNYCYRLFRPTQFRVTMVITLHTHRARCSCRYFEPMKYLEAIKWNLLARLDTSPCPRAKTFKSSGTSPDSVLSGLKGFHMDLHHLDSSCKEDMSFRTYIRYIENGTAPEPDCHFPITDVQCLAPFLRNSSTIFVWPSASAACNAVRPPSLPAGALISAPSAFSFSTTFIWPPSAAACNALVP